MEFRVISQPKNSVHFVASTSDAAKYFGFIDVIGHGYEAITNLTFSMTYELG